MKATTAEQAAPERPQKRPGRPLGSTSKTPPNPLLGTMPDGKLAPQLGMTEGAVRQARQRAGIPPFDASRAGKYLWCEENVALLGTLSDSEIARRLGLTVQAVGVARRLRGIPVFRSAEPKRRGRPPVPADQRLTERAEMRMTAAERSKYEALGGADWVREQIRRAKVPA